MRIKIYDFCENEKNIKKKKQLKIINGKYIGLLKSKFCRVGILSKN